MYQKPVGCKVQSEVIWTCDACCRSLGLCSHLINVHGREATFHLQNEHVTFHFYVKFLQFLDWFLRPIVGPWTFWAPKFFVDHKTMALSLLFSDVIFAFSDDNIEILNLGKKDLLQITILKFNKLFTEIFHIKTFVNLKSNLAFLYKNILTSAFPQKLVKLIKFPLKSWIFTY